jgi:hypothetical protein
MTETPVFINWHKAEVARRLGWDREVEKAVEEAMQRQNIRIEVNDGVRWNAAEEATLKPEET